MTTANSLAPGQLEQLAINTIRFLSVDAIQQADSGHPGLPLGAAPMAYVLWTRFLRHNPANPHWFDRDRFVLSAGHGSMLLYSLLHLTGYDLPLEQIKQFRQWFGGPWRDHPLHRDLPDFLRLYAAADGLRRGAYVLTDDAHGIPDLILIGTGSEVGLIVTAGGGNGRDSGLVQVCGRPRGGGWRGSFRSLGPG